MANAGAPKDSQPQNWLIFIMVAIGIFMATLDGSIVNIALPTIMADFGVELATIQWVVMIYLLTVTSLLLSFGRLSDIKGRRIVYSTGLVIFSLGSLLCGMAPSPYWLIGARFFQGLGAAMNMACTPALVVDTFPESERGKAIGMMGSVVAAGLTTGPVLGGLLIHYFSWRFIFYINIPIGILTAAGVFFLLKGSKADITRPETFDWPGAALLAVLLGSFLLAITHAYDWGYLSTPTLSLLSICLFAAVTLLKIEVKVRHPILSRSLFAIRLFSLPIIAAVILFLCLFILVFLMPFYLVHPAGYPVNTAGTIMACIFVALFVVSPFSGALYDRIGSRLLTTLAFGLIAASLLSLAVIPAQMSTFSIIWRLSLAGIGTAVFLPPNSAAAFSAVAPHQRGVASAIVAAARTLGMVMGVAIAGAIFNNVFYKLSHGLSLKEYQPALEGIFMKSYHYVMMGGVFIAVLGMITSFLRGPEPKLKEALSGTRPKQRGTDLFS
ncbi:MAG: MFS transporter [Desulfobulbales bacterium]